MGLIERMRKQKAIYWSQTGTTRDGQSTFSTPVEISVRWENKAVKFLTPNGAESVTTAVVYVDRDVLPGDYLKQGTIGAETSTNPKARGATMIRQIEHLPNLRNTKVLRTALL